MAVMMIERAVRAVIAQLQATLNAEISHVKINAQINLDLPAVTAWRSYDAGVATPDVAEGEVYEIGDGGFWEREAQESLWQGGRTPVLSEIQMRVAINHANRGNADTNDATLLAHQMASRSRLYLAALVRTLRNDPDVGTFGTIALSMRAFRTGQRDVTRIDATLRAAGRVEVDFTARLSESSDNETVAGGGALPAATMESP